MAQNRNLQTNNNQNNGVITNVKNLITRIPVFQIATIVPPNHMLVHQNLSGTKIYRRKSGLNFWNPLIPRRVYIIDLSKKMYNINIKQDNTATTSEGYEVTGNVCVSFKVNPQYVNKLINETSANEQFKANSIAIIKQLISGIPWDTLRNQSGQVFRISNYSNTSDIRLAIDEIAENYGIQIEEIMINKMTPIRNDLAEIDENERVSRSQRDIARANAENQRDISSRAMETEIANTENLMNFYARQGLTQEEIYYLMMRRNLPQGSVVIDGNPQSNYFNPMAMIMAYQNRNQQFNGYPQQYDQFGNPIPMPNQQYQQNPYPNQQYNGYPQQGYPQQYDQFGNPIPMPNQQYQQYQQNPDPNQQQHTR